MTDDSVLLHGGAVAFAYYFSLLVHFFLFLCSSPEKCSNTSKIEHTVMPFNQTPVGAETSIYIDKIITIQEVTTVGVERVTADNEVLSGCKMMLSLWLLYAVEGLEMICCYPAICHSFMAMVQFL